MDVNNTQKPPDQAGTTQGRPVLLRRLLFGQIQYCELQGEFSS